MNNEASSVLIDTSKSDLLFKKKMGRPSRKITASSVVIEMPGEEPMYYAIDKKGNATYISDKQSFIEANSQKEKDKPKKAIQNFNSTAQFQFINGVPQFQYPIGATQFTIFYEAAQIQNLNEAEHFQYQEYFNAQRNVPLPDPSGFLNFMRNRSDTNLY
ncbi:hypothetical protein M9Y10_036869 [Tritrichomonas musculus]|uniref:Uncharacterized protein n=2 Tax=Tritrichomonas musculus TaxID=1915356 RepID=A0ABR2GV94_9EUKA